MLLTPDQMLEIRKVIEDHHSAFIVNAVGAEAVDPEVQKHLEDKGLITTELESIRESYLYGQLLAMLETKKAAKMSYAEFKEYVRKNPVPLNDIEQHAIKMSVMSAGQYCKGLGNRVNTKTGQVLIEADANLRARMETEIRTATSENIARRETTRQLKSDLGWATGDWARDWNRIAVTEKQTAMQNGVADHYRKKHGPDVLVFKRAMSDACRHCQRVHNGPDGHPRIYKLSTLEANGTNVGKKANDWQAVVGTVHPHCACSMSRVPEGWGFNEEGDLVPGGEFGQRYESEEELALAMQKENDLQKAFKLQGHLKIHGIPIAIENKKNSVRRWTDPEGNSGNTKMRGVQYGYVKGTLGADGDEIDCFVGPDPRATNVFVVEQQNPHTGTYDEQKTMIAFSNQHLAEKAYREHYHNDGVDHFLTIEPMDIAQFKRWVAGTKPKPDEMIKTGEVKKSLDPMLVIPLEKAMYIGPRGGKWQDPQHTIPWKEPSKRTGVISVSDKLVTEVTNKLLEKVEVNEDGDVVATSDIQFEHSIKDVKGRPVKVVIQLKNMAEETDEVGEGVSGEADIYRGDPKELKEGQERATVTIYNVGDFDWEHAELKRAVRANVAHELAHVKELLGASKQVKQRKRKQASHVEMTPEEYYNSKTEVTARLQEIMRDITDRSSVRNILEAKEKGKSYRPEQAVAASVAWGEIEEYLTDNNKKRILKAAARLVEAIEEKRIDPITKSLSPQQGARHSPAGKRAPGPGEGINYVIPVPVRKKRDKSIKETGYSPDAEELLQDKQEFEVGALYVDKEIYEMLELLDKVFPWVVPEHDKEMHEQGRDNKDKNMAWVKREFQHNAPDRGNMAAVEDKEPKVRRFPVK